MTPYIVQRCKFEKEFDDQKSFDGNIQCDYMGSAEFEFGALPKSLRHICANLDQYQWFDVDGYPVKYLATAQSDDIEHFITACAKEQYPSNIRTKEVVNLHSSLNYDPKDDPYKNWLFDMWWDLENHFMFVRTNDTRKFDQDLDIVLANTAPKLA